MLLIVGRVKRLTSRPVSFTDKRTGEVRSFEEVRVAIGSEEDLNATWCQLGRDFGETPQEGDLVAAEAFVRTWASSDSRTGAGYGLTLTRRVGLADVMPSSGGSGVRLAAVGE